MGLGHTGLGVGGARVGVLGWGWSTLGLGYWDEGY